MATSMVMPKQYFYDDRGQPLANGKVYTYEKGTTTPKTTYANADASAENTNPVILNSEGYASIYLEGEYTIVVQDQNDVIQWTDNASSITLTDWVNCTECTYISTTSFSVTGNRVDVFESGRNVRVNNGTGTYSYSEIATSTVSGGNTVVTINDAVVAAGVVGVCVSVLSASVTNQEQRVSNLESAVSANSASIATNTTNIATNTTNIATNTTNIATNTTNIAAMVGNFQHGSSGYEITPNGLIIQWSTISLNAVNYTGSFNFPIAFPNSVYSIAIAQRNLAGGPSASLAIPPNTLSLTGFSLRNFSGSYGCGASYIVIGK